MYYACYLFLNKMTVMVILEHVSHLCVTHIENVKKNMESDYGVEGWLRLVGSLRLYVSFVEYGLFYTLFRKRDVYF